MFNDVTEDFDRCCQVDYNVSAENCRNKIWVWLNGYGLQAITAHRLYRWSLGKTNAPGTALRLPLIPLTFLLHILIGRMYDIKISRHAVIGPGCYIGHFGGIRIGNCRIGALCNINHQVKLGDFKSGDEDGRGVIGDRVWIGSHSRIAPGVCIGSGCAVSAGSTVDSDLPARVLVAGPSARIIQRDYDNRALLGLVKRKD